jgi:MFS family permease
MSEPTSAPPSLNRWLTRGVLGIGLASLFSDWGHEAATALLPAFIAGLGAPPYALGVIEGVSDGLSSFAKLAGGWIADRPPWRKPTGITGYLATALSTFGYAFARTWPAILVVRALGWVGRGSRGPSRDTLLTDCVAPDQVGRAFGFERAMDTLGAVLGPLSATALIGVLGARGVLRWTLVPGLAAAVVFASFAPVGRTGGEHRVTSFTSSFRQLPKTFWHFLAGVFAHGIGDFAPTLLILRATQILSPRLGMGRAAAISVGLYTIHNFVSAAASYPAGALGDRVGKRGLLAAGYLVGTITYAGFILEPPTLPVLVILFGLAGIHQAVQQSLEKSLAAELLPAAGRGSGFGVLATVNGIGDLVSSVMVGALWSEVSPVAGFAYAGILTMAGALLIYFFIGHHDGRVEF